jgi:hypothetical protein
MWPATGSWEAPFHYRTAQEGRSNAKLFKFAIAYLKTLCKMMRLRWGGRIKQPKATRHENEIQTAGRRRFQDSMRSGRVFILKSLISVQPRWNAP